MKILNKSLLQILLVLLVIPVYGKDEEEGPIEPLHVGNFSLPSSQQPSTFVSFGENNLNKGEAQVAVYADAFLGNNSYQTDVFPNFLYGITDDLTILLVLPFSPGNKDRGHHSSGLEDGYVQFDYAYYNKTTALLAAQATVVASVFFPTGSSTKNPPTGFGAMSYFLGFTYNHLTPNWYWYVSPGLIVPTSRHGTKFGEQLLYQFGLERYLPSPPGWIFGLFIELDGIYSWKNRIDGSIDPNSGGNVAYLTPSMWFSSKRTIFQVGIGFPVIQNLNGDQTKKNFSLQFGFTYTL